MATVEVLEADVTTLRVDAIANAANTDLRHGGGVAAAIARAAGAELERESRERAPIALGAAVATTAGELPCRHVIHAATMRLGGSASPDTVRACTRSALRVAEELGDVRSLALVAFGAGIGGVDLAEAASIEAAEVAAHLRGGSGLERVVFAVRGAAARAAFERAVGEAGP